MEEILPAINIKIDFNEEGVEDGGIVYYSSTLLSLKKELDVLKEDSLKNKDKIFVKEQNYYNKN